MHENRETSCAPALLAGRSAKADGRKADRNAEEESDCGVVPVSQPNNEAQVSAEETQVGTPQGAVVSPLLANVYLPTSSIFGWKHGARKWRRAMW